MTMPSFKSQACLAKHKFLTNCGNYKSNTIKSNQIKSYLWSRFNAGFWREQKTKVAGEKLFEYSSTKPTNSTVCELNLVPIGRRQRLSLFHQPSSLSMILSLNHPCWLLLKRVKYKTLFCLQKANHYKHSSCWVHLPSPSCWTGIFASDD